MRKAVLSGEKARATKLPDFEMFFPEVINTLLRNG
jgi:hypothetical protein